MLAELLEHVKKLATHAAEPKLLPEVPGADPTVRHLFNPADQSLTLVTVLPPARRHTVVTLLSLANAIQRYDGLPEVTCWCAMDKIVAVMDDSKTSFRRDQVTLVLQPSPLFKLLHDNGSKKFSQKDLFRFLKHDLAQAKVVPDGFVDIIAALKFHTQSETEGQVSAVGKNTFGRSVMADVRGTAAIPEEIDIAFDPWPSAGIWEKEFQVNVLCSIFIDSVEGTISVTPQPGQIEAAKATALDALCLRVAEVTGMPSESIFAGTP